MPELPEIETVKNGIEKAIGKAHILNVEIFCRKFREPIPESFEKEISPSKITNYRRLGKYLIIDLDNKKSILWHLGMSGRIKIFQQNPTLEKHDHAVIQTNKGWLVFNDARRFGILTCCETDKILEHKCLKNMGIDPFDKGFDAKYLFACLNNKRIPIKIALLDQTIVAGIGNIYASEILYLANISPLRDSSEIRLKECETLVKCIREVLQKAIDLGGSTLKDYQKPDGSLGYFQNMHSVYNKTGQRCPNCACDINNIGGIKKIIQAGRSTFYCPAKQK